MSLKSIDMQVSVHRNPEAGQLQQQLQHKQVHDQAVLADTTDKNAIRERQRSAKVDDTAEAKIRDEGHSGGGRGNHPDERRPGKAPDGKGKAGEKGIEHPFKGHHIDLSL